MSKGKVAVVLMNLGGPTSLGEVESFLFNLFFDKAIIRLPLPLRYLIAKLISKKRLHEATEIYKQMGGKSPILEETVKQSSSLDKMLRGKDSTKEYKSFVVMRHAPPRAFEIIKEIEQYCPSEIVLLPLYPQFSTTTTASSVEEFKKLAKKSSIRADIKTICCYPEDESFIKSHVELIKNKIIDFDIKDYRVLFSAHGLPESVIKAGDPYQYQVEKTVASIVNFLNIEELDYKICYQSRVGPMKWIGPDTESEIIKAAKENKKIVVVPVAFVSEHSETLVELDIQYRELANQNGCKEYIRVEALGANYNFIESLANSCLTILKQTGKNIACSSNIMRVCPKEFCGCLNK